MNAGRASWAALFSCYVKRLEELKGQAEAALADAENTRKQFAPKCNDTSVFEPFIAELTRLSKFASTELEPDKLDGLRPLLQSDEPPIDYSGGAGQ